MTWWDAGFGPVVVPAERTRTTSAGAARVRDVHGRRLERLGAVPGARSVRRCPRTSTSAFVLRALALEHGAAAAREGSDRGRRGGRVGRTAERRRTCSDASRSCADRAHRGGDPRDRATRRCTRRTLCRGQRVRVRRMRPAGHTRCPRYVRGATGLVEDLRGVDVFPDIGRTRDRRSRSTRSSRLG